MEVHHHSHLALGETHTERKKWTHYLWEFIMLFLAVTLGFFVENQREHYIEHQREKQFVQSLFNDVKIDTENLIKIINARTAKDHVLDSFSYMMNSDSIKFFSKQIYYYAVGIARTLPYRFVPNDGTMQQLKNSGAFRLIRKRTVVDSVSKYDVNVRNMIGQWAVEENLIDHYRDAATKIFDATAFKQLLDENANVVRMPDDNPALQSFNKRELDEWNYRLFTIQSINKANRRDLRSLLKQAENLLMLLQNEYHLK